MEKTFENASNLESIELVHDNDAITVSEKLIGVIAPLIRDENNANLHRAEEKQIAQSASNRSEFFTGNLMHSSSFTLHTWHFGGGRRCLGQY